jgi:hypothetical protein
LDAHGTQQRHPQLKFPTIFPYPSSNTIPYLITGIVSSQAYNCQPYKQAITKVKALADNDTEKGKSF